MMLFNMAGTTRRGIWSYLPALNDINIKEISVNPLELDMEVDTEQSHGHIERGSTQIQIFCIKIDVDVDSPLIEGNNK